MLFSYQTFLFYPCNCPLNLISVFHVFNILLNLPSNFSLSFSIAVRDRKKQVNEYRLPKYSLFKSARKFLKYTYLSLFTKLQLKQFFFSQRSKCYKIHNFIKHSKFFRILKIQISFLMKTDVSLWLIFFIYIS